MKTLKHLAIVILALAAFYIASHHPSALAQPIPSNISVVGGPSSFIDGKIAFTSTYNKEMLEAAPRWHPADGNPPLSISDAQRTAASLLAKTIPNSKDWKLKDISLQQPLASFDEVPEGIWIYLFTFNGPKVKGRVNSFVTIAILLDGKAVPLTRVEPKK